MTEKIPPVLSDKECLDNVVIPCEKCLHHYDHDKTARTCLECIARQHREAQLDAAKAHLDDVELAIQQAKQEGYKQGVKDQYECQQIDLEQAKEEVAREMIDWSNEWCPHRDNDFPCPNYVPGELRLCKRDCPDCWQTLKDRKW